MKPKSLGDNGALVAEGGKSKDETEGVLLPISSSFFRHFHTFSVFANHQLCLADFLSMKRRPLSIEALKVPPLPVMPSSALWRQWDKAGTGRITRQAFEELQGPWRFNPWELQGPFGNVSRVKLPQPKGGGH